MLSVIDIKKKNFVYFCLTISIILRLEFVTLRPNWQAPDEFPHFYHAKYISKYNKQPEFKPEFPEYECGQPVLYYFLSSIILKFSSSFSETEYKNIDKMFEMKKLLPEAVILRLFSFLLGILTLLIIRKIFLKIFEERPDISNVLIILAAFHPAFMENTTSISNDVLAYLIGALIILEIPGRTYLEKPIETGILLSLGLLTKSSMLLFIPFVIIIIIFSKIKTIKKIQSVLLILLPLALTYIFLLILSKTFNVKLWILPPILVYSEPISFLRIFHVTKNFFGSFWAAFGRIYEIHPSVFIYLIIFLPVTLVSIAGVFKFILKNYRFPGNAGIEAKFLLITSLFIAGSLFFSIKCTWTGTENTSWGKNIFPVLPAIYVLFYTGVKTIIKKRTLEILLILAGIYFIIDIWGLIRLIQ